MNAVTAMNSVLDALPAFGALSLDHLVVLLALSTLALAAFVVHGAFAILRRGGDLEKR